MNERLSDQQLIEKYLRGNEACFELLVKRYLPNVYGLARRYTGNPDNASDIAQETFLKVWKNIKKFDTQRSFKAWVLVIAKNTALDWLKAKRAIPFSMFENNREDEEWSILESIVDPLPLQDALVDQKALFRKAETILSSIPQIYASVVNLREREELSFAEISKKLKKPVNTVKSQYRRALKILKETPKA